MPKKRKKPEEPEQEEIEEPEEAKDDNRESELEEDIDDGSDDSNLNLNLQGLEFHQFMHLAQDSTESGAPVLERMALSAPRPIFVGGIPREVGVSPGNNNVGDEFKYVSSNADANEPKYLSEPGANAPERIDLTQARRTGSFREEISQERFFMQSEPKIESQTMERFERPTRFNDKREIREGIPEREERKYRPKLPRS